MEKCIKLANHQDCTGCGACVDACPKNCISFKKEGLHDYPIIADSCVKCGKCMSVCPILNKENRDMVSMQRYYCAWNENMTDRLTSTSGGAGSAMATWANINGYYVCGAGFDNRWYLRHVITNDKEALEAFKGSKYLKSDTLGIFRKVKELIASGNRILFTGTPCQCDAMEHYLTDKEKGNLITLSIICHGVNSPVVWGDYVNYLEKTNGSKLVKYNFRSKSKGWRHDRGGGGKLRVFSEFSNGKKSDVPSWRNLFHCWFGFHYILRPSCFHCPYRKKERTTDIVIGDFWGLNKVLPSLETKAGASVVITTSDKGEQFLHSCENLQLIQVDASATEKVLKGFVEKRAPEGIQKEIEVNSRFECEYLKSSFDEMAKKYAPETYLERILASLRSRLHI